MAQKRRKDSCEVCGKEYETYAIIIDCNPLSIASLLEEEQKRDGSFRRVCSECRDKTKHEWQPTDTSGHCLECSNCGKETSIYRKEYNKKLEERCEKDVSIKKLKKDSN
jgi:hypothetical protein